MSATEQTTRHLCALCCSVVNSVYRCCVLPVNSTFFFLQEGELLPPTGSLCLCSSLTSANLRLGHFGEKVSTWQTVNKGDSGRAEGEEAAGVKPCWLETQERKVSLYCQVIQSTVCKHILVYRHTHTHKLTMKIQFCLQLSGRISVYMYIPFMWNRPCFHSLHHVHPRSWTINHCPSSNSSHLVSRAAGIHSQSLSVCLPFNLQHLTTSMLYPKLCALSIF